MMRIIIQNFELAYLHINESLNLPVDDRIEYIFIRPPGSRIESNKIIKKHF